MSVVACVGDYKEHKYTTLLTDFRSFFRAKYFLVFLRCPPASLPELKVIYGVSSPWWLCFLPKELLTYAISTEVVVTEHSSETITGRENSCSFQIFLNFLGTAASKTCKLANASLVNCTVNASNNTSWLYLYSNPIHEHNTSCIKIEMYDVMTRLAAHISQGREEGWQRL